MRPGFATKLHSCRRSNRRRLRDRDQARRDTRSTTTRLPEVNSYLQLPAQVLQHRSPTLRRRRESQLAPVVLTRNKLEHDRQRVRKILLDNVAPLNRSDALRNIIFQREIAKLSHTRESISIDVQKSGDGRLIEMGQRERRTRNVNLRSKRRHELLHKRSLATRQRAFQHHRIPRPEERRQRRRRPRGFFPAPANDAKFPHSQKDLPQKGTKVT